MNNNAFAAERGASSIHPLSGEVLPDTGNLIMKVQG